MSSQQRNTDSSEIRTAAALRLYARGLAFSSLLCPAAPSCWLLLPYESEKKATRRPNFRGRHHTPLHCLDCQFDPIPPAPSLSPRLLCLLSIWHHQTQNPLTCTCTCPLETQSPNLVFFNRASCFFALHLQFLLLSLFPFSGSFFAFAELQQPRSRHGLRTHTREEGDLLFLALFARCCLDFYFLRLKRRPNRPLPLLVSSLPSFLFLFAPSHSTQGTASK